MPGVALSLSLPPPRAPTRSMRQPAQAGQSLAGPQASLLFQVSGCTAAMHSILAQSALHSMRHSLPCTQPLQPHTLCPFCRPVASCHADSLLICLRSLVHRRVVLCSTLHAA